MLYLVPTPIGNLGDMTMRAIQTLKEVDLILVEDTRVSKTLLRNFDISTPYKSFHLNNEHKSVETIIHELQSGKKIALISDAGSPAISDPGFLLVRACRQVGMEVIALPGATALIPAISASGLPCEKFFFQGFLPTKKGRATQLKFLSKLPVTIVIYESPHRIVKTIAELKEIFGNDRDCSIAKEISKLYEKYFTGSLEEVYQQIVQIPKMHGEFVLCIGPATNLKSALKQKFTDDDE